MPEAQFNVSWREVPGVLGYMAGDNGEVWSCWTRVGLGITKGTRSVMGTKWRCLKPGNNGTGYLHVNVGGKVKYLHRLILESFVGPCPAGLEACHDPDPDKSNCSLSNLRWGTRKSNLADAIREGRMTHGEQAHSSVLTEDLVRQIRAEYATGTTSTVKLAIKHGVRQGTIWYIVARKTWKHVV